MILPNLIWNMQRHFLFFEPMANATAMVWSQNGGECFSPPA